LHLRAEESPALGDSEAYRLPASVCLVFFRPCKVGLAGNGALSKQTRPRIELASESELAVQELRIDGIVAASS